MTPGISKLTLIPPTTELRERLALDALGGHAVEPIDCCRKHDIARACDTEEGHGGDEVTAAGRFYLVRPREERLDLLSADLYESAVRDHVNEADRRHDASGVPRLGDDPVHRIAVCVQWPPAKFAGSSVDVGDGAGL